MPMPRTKALSRTVFLAAPLCLRAGLTPRLPPPATCGQSVNDRSRDSAQCPPVDAREAVSRSSLFLQDEQDLEVGLHLLQRKALELRDTKSRQTLVIEENAELEASDIRSCAHRIPFTPAALAAQALFEEVNLVRPLRRSYASAEKQGLQAVRRSDRPRPGSWFPDASFETTNRIAKWLLSAWAVVAFGLCFSSVVSVAVYPKKQASENLVGLSLADDEGAWNRGPLYWLSLSWVDSLMAFYGKCWSSVVDDQELVLKRDDRSYAPQTMFKAAWSQEIKRAGGIADASIARALFKTIGFRGFTVLFIAVVVEQFMSMIGMVLALDWFVSHLEVVQTWQVDHPDEPASLLEPTILVVVLIFGVPMIYRSAFILVTLLDGYYNNRCAAGLASAVFEKAMELPAGSCPQENDTEEGWFQSKANMKPHIVQLLNVDICEAWHYLLRSCMSIAISPIIVIVLFALLIAQIRTAGILGCLYIVPLAVICQFIACFAFRMFMEYQGYVDSRMKTLTEAMLNVRTLKALAWESVAYSKLNSLRDLETYTAFKLGIVHQVLGALMHSVPWGTVLCALLYIIFVRGDLRAHEIIVIQRIMASLLAEIKTLALGINKLIEVPNNFRRIKKFLETAERPQNVVRAPPDNPDAPIVRVCGSFTFLKGAQCKPVLHDVDIAIPRGDLVGVVGGVASGKTALLQAVLGELYPQSLNASVEAPLPSTKKVAYHAQVPWIFEGTLRENVILNQPMDSERYCKALFAAGLTSDLEVLPGGDQVCIGSYGIRLSGGQRARVSMARAAYMENAEIVVIDDPFASVDAPMGEHICNELICGPLLQEKTRFVTLQPNPAHLRKFKRVLVMDEGRIVFEGPPAEAMSSEPFLRLMSSQYQTRKPGGHDHDAVGHQEGTPRPEREARTAMVIRRKQAEETHTLRAIEVQDHFTFASCWWYVRAAGFFNISALLVVIFVQRYSGLLEFLAIASWVDAKLSYEVDDITYVLRIVAIVGCTMIAIVLNGITGQNIILSAARLLHSTVMYNIFRAPIDRFFDKQPVGRLINRLSFDMKQVDDSVIVCGYEVVMFCLGFFTTQTFVLAVVGRTAALCAIPFYCIAMFFTYIYRGAAVPMVFHAKFNLSHLQDLQATALGSCVSIRVNSMAEDFQSRHNHHSQSAMRCNYLIYSVCQGWLQSRVFLCMSAITGLFALSGLWSGMPLGTLSVIISLSFLQMQEFEDIAGSTTNLINSLNALQRLTKYFSAQKEAPARMPGDAQIRIRQSVKSDHLAVLTLEAGAGAAQGVTQGAAELLLRGVSEKPANPQETAKDPIVVRLKASRCLVLRARKDGRALQLVEGQKLRDVFPGCEELRSVDDPYDIVMVNNATGAAEMAQELCKPSPNVWIDLWHASYSSGMRVQMEDLTAGYGNEQNILQKINIDIPPCCKMGFVGKTGCGKSTSLLCMLRIIEPRAGRISINGIDIQKLGLNTVRNVFGLVPQDPTVFEGTVRHNVDPLGQFTDAAIWEALTNVQFTQYVREQAQGLDWEITQEGANLSLGQRQLLSLARMVIRQPPVLLLDECTSALDPRTQEAVQNTLMSKFPHSTIIAVAHRVETILSFDRITVFAGGQVAEHGSVEEVLKMNGIFARMVEASK